MHTKIIVIAEINIHFIFLFCRCGCDLNTFSVDLRLDNQKYADTDPVKDGLTGPIPSEIGNLEKLEVLHLQVNSLEGEIPITVMNLDSLGKYYHLYCCDTDYCCLLFFINYHTIGIVQHYAHHSYHHLLFCCFA